MTHVHYFITELIPSPILICFLFFIGFYILLLTFNVNVYLSFIGAAAYTFASFNIISLEVGHINKLYDMALSAPILAGAVLAYHQKRYLLGAAVTALFTSLQIFYGHVQITYYLLLLILFFVVARLIISIKEKTLSHFLKASVILLIAAIIGVAPNTSKLWSTAEYSKATTRGGSELLTQKTEGTGLDKEYAFQWSNDVMESFTLFIPYFYGGSSKEALGKSSEVYKAISKKTSDRKIAKEYSNNVPGYWGEQPMTSGPVYIGAIICFLFVLGLFLIKGPTKWWILSISILAIMLSWGRNFMPLSELFFNYFPLYNKFRSVTMIQCIVQITFALLAFLTLRDIIQGSIKKDQALFALKWSTIIMGGIALFFGLLGTALFDFTSESDAERMKQFPEWLWEAIMEDRKSIFRGDAFRSFFLVIITAGFIWALVTEKIKKEIFYGALAILILFDMVVVARRYFVKKAFGIKKNYEKEVFVTTNADEVILKDTDPYFRVFNTTTGLTGDAVTSYYHKSLGGYSAIKLRRYQDIIDSALYKFNREVINMLNTKYFIQKDTMNNYYAVPNPGALGNAWFVDKYEFVKNADEEIVKLQNFNASTTAIFDDDFKQYLQGKSFAKDPSASIKLTDYHPNRLKFKSVASTPQLAVFSDIYYQPGWNAYIDGKLTPHFRANYILRSMVIPNGEHVIEFKFEPETYFTSENISLIGSIILVVFLIGITGVLIFSKKENVGVA